MTINFIIGYDDNQLIIMMIISFVKINNYDLIMMIISFVNINNYDAL